MFEQQMPFLIFTSQATYLILRKSYFSEWVYRKNRTFAYEKVPSKELTDFVLDKFKFEFRLTLPKS